MQQGCERLYTHDAESHDILARIATATESLIQRITLSSPHRKGHSQVFRPVTFQHTATTADDHQPLLERRTVSGVPF